MKEGQTNMMLENFLAEFLRNTNKSFANYLIGRLTK